MLTVGTDSYVTVEQADDYISKYYSLKSADRKRWEEISTEDKEIPLRQACAMIETLPLQGRKAISGQALSFPRLPFQYGNTEKAPQSIKTAQIELALWLTDEKKQAEISKRSGLQEQGVKSFSIGDLSETYEGTSTSTALMCPKAKVLLTPYLNGGYATC